MAVARTRALRNLQGSLRYAGARATPRTQLAVGRRWASGGAGGHGHAEPTSDLPWLAGAIAVTIPAVWYLWPTAHADAGHHGEHAEEHAEEHEEKVEEEEAPQEEEKPAAEEEKPAAQEEKPAKEEKPAPEPEKKEESSEDKPSGTEGESQPKAPDANKESAPKEIEGEEQKETPENKGSVDGVKFKGHIKEGSKAAEDTRKREPDSKGGYKKRIDSANRVELGTEPHEGYDSENAPSPAKEPAESQGSMSKKQAGMSNTATRHSTDAANDPEKSKKPEGGPDTAKTMGTVDPARPQK